MTTPADQQADQPAPQSTENPLFPDGNEIMAAAQLPVAITPVEDLDGDGQMPYEKADRVPEIALQLERRVIEVLEQRRDPERDELAFTAGRLRMMAASSRVDEEEGPRYLVALFEILATEGGNRVDGGVVATQWSETVGGFAEEPTWEVGPLIDYGDAAAEYDREQRAYAAGALPGPVEP